jgi:hypothetical protein
MHWESDPELLVKDLGHQAGFFISQLATVALMWFMMHSGLPMSFKFGSRKDRSIRFATFAILDMETYLGYQCSITHPHTPCISGVMHVVCQAPVYTKEDLLVVVRDSKTEVWTLRAFGPSELYFIPRSNEFKDPRRQVWCQHITEAV